MSGDLPPDDPRRSERCGWPFLWVDAPEQRASRDRLAALEAARNRNHERHWPRDAPVSWSALGGGLLFHGAALLALVAHFGLGILYVMALLSERVGGALGWVLAIAWGVLCLFAVREWLFGRISVVLAPVVAALLLVGVGGWPL